VKIISILGFLLVISGCGTIGVIDPSLKVRVKPYPAVRGERALFILNAPMDADEAKGVLEIFTSPSFKFKKNSKKGYWYISEKIPKTDLVPPGTYSVRLFYSYKGKPPRYNRMRLQLK